MFAERVNVCAFIASSKISLSSNVEREKPYIQAYTTVEKPLVEETVFSSC